MANNRNNFNYLIRENTENYRIKEEIQKVSSLLQKK